ncbi:hypothetical protein EST38_g3709 [Candolleomyces aberdarensis]|uniref:Uncharacterized protein n=1 Tax=Candolleomyces aberdarensis TaxID=2316362 RepID=A0A4Q2DPX0_9AGAR|nr:hypothetical protein EST38_g3709 [Candolleomyces aberdarensis]
MTTSKPVVLLLGWTEPQNAFYRALVLNLAMFCGLTALGVLTISSNLTAPHPPSIRLAFALTQNLIVLTAFWVLLRSTLIPFVYGECRLRYCHGFRETELVIRRSPRSLRLEKLTAVNENNNIGNKVDLGMISQSIDTFSRTAQRLISPQLLYCRAGALLSKDYWTLEYTALFDAYKAVSDGEITEDVFEFSVWKQEHGRWTACELWRLQEIMTGEQESHVFETLTSSEKH